MPTELTWSPPAALKAARGKHRDRNWVRTINYATIPRGDLKSTAYGDYRWEFYQEHYQGDWRQNDGQSRVYDTPVGPRNTLQALYDSFSTSLTAYQNANRPTDATMRNRLLVQALAKTSDAKTNLAVTLAEAQKASDLILNRVSRLYWAYRDFRRLDFKAVANTLGIDKRAVHKTWLEYQYGWLPLVMDVKNTAEFFAQQKYHKPARFSVTTKETVKALSGDVPIGPYAPSALPYPTPMRYEQIRFDTTYKVKLYLEVVNPHFVRLQQLGITNPLLVAWELTPFSFVFDWACQVGDWLQGLTALHGLAVRDAFFSKATGAYIGRYFHSSTKRVFPTTYVVSNDSYGARYRGYSRAPFVVNVADTYPPVDINLTFRRLVSGLALIRGQVSRLDRSQLRL